MGDVRCPYCDAKIEIDDPSGCYVGENEYECPECERMFMLKGEISIEYSAKTAEEAFGWHIRNAKGNIENLQKISKEEPENAEWAKQMLDRYYQEELDKYEEALAEMLEHNSNAKPIEEI